MSLELGSRLGRIRIDALLGVGGMGSVYQGFDERLERPVAIKEVHAEKRTAAVRNRFLREARALSQLDHPNICRIYDVLERTDGDYLILELIDGRTLRNHMNDGLSRAETLRVVLQVARVLSVAHERGIVHRDLKPDNIMLSRSGEVKVLDFGLARFANESTHARIVSRPEREELADDYDLEQTAVLGRPQATTAGSDPSQTFAGSLVGTLTYMSPEQARGLPVDSASDIYSLGVVLFEVLTGGTRPYGEMDSLNELLKRVRGAEVQWRDFGSRGVNALLHRMLELRAVDRPNAQEVAAALEAEILRPVRVRRRWMAAAMVAAALLLSAGGIFAARAYNESRAILNAERRGRLAFLPFRNETGDKSLAWVELGLTQLVAGGISGVRGVKVVPVEEVAGAMRDLRMPRGGKLTEAQRARLLDALGAGALIESAVIPGGEAGKYTIRFGAVAKERVDRIREVTSTLLTEAANQMVHQLSVTLDPAAPPADLDKSYSGDAFANTAYAIGKQEELVRGPISAVKYYAVAVDRDPAFGGAKIELAEMRHSLGEHVEAMRLANEVIEEARRRGDRRLQSVALARLAGMHNHRSDYASGERAAREALQIALQLGDSGAISEARNAIGHAAWRTNRLDLADEMFRAVLAVTVKEGDLRAQPRIMNNVALVAEDRGQAEEAERLYRQALAIADRINAREAAATVIGNLAGLRIGKGDVEPLLRRQAALARELGDRLTEVMALLNLAIVVYSNGREEEAITLTSQAADVAKAVDDPRVESMGRSNAAYARTRRGDLETAGRDAAAAMALIPRLGGDVESISEVRMGYVYWLIRTGQLAEAERLIEESEREFRPTVRTMRMRARIAYARGDYEGAARVIQQGKAMGDQWLAQDEAMREAFLESARTGKPATIEFELPVKR